MLRLSVQYAAETKRSGLSQQDHGASTNAFRVTFCSSVCIMLVDPAPSGADAVDLVVVTSQCWLSLTAEKLTASVLVH